MKYKQGLTIAVVALGLLVKISMSGSGSFPHEQITLPLLETFIVEPIELDQLSIWVPADKNGPAINRSCRLRGNCQYTCILPAGVEHTRSKDCPEAIGRLLAEYTWPYHQDSLPLTILNGWKWEYSYSLSQFETVSYDLPSRGGSWENCLEAVLNQTRGSARGTWLYITQDGQFLDTPHENLTESHIEISTFSSIRTRHGYPKERILER